MAKRAARSASTSSGSSTPQTKTGKTAAKKAATKTPKKTSQKKTGQPAPKTEVVIAATEPAPPAAKASKKTAKKATKKKTSVKRPTKKKATRKKASPKKAVSIKAADKTTTASVQIVTLSHDQIAERAFCIWVGKGRPDGQDQVNWLQAISELEEEAKAMAK